MTHLPCLIFDLDGTLVDSEPWSSQAYLNLIPHIQESLDTFTRRYRGWKFSVVLEDIERTYGKALPPDFETVYRKEVATLFHSRLKPIDGAAQALEQLDNPKCIASNGPLAKMQLTLELTALRPFFGNKLYSAYEALSWKPEPGLFLYAATAMDADPSDCVVIEDSEVGLAGAREAGMQVVHYCPEGHSNCDLWIKHLSELPDVIWSL